MIKFDLRTGILFFCPKNARKIPDNTSVQTLILHGNTYLVGNSRAMIALLYNNILQYSGVLFNHIHYARSPCTLRQRCQITSGHGGSGCCCWWWFSGRCTCCCCWRCCGRSSCTGGAESMAAAVVASESRLPSGTGTCMSSLDAPSHLSLMALTSEGRFAHLYFNSIVIAFAIRRCAAWASTLITHKHSPKLDNQVVYWYNLALYETCS